jgi:alpha-L-fucosidase
MTTTNNKFLLLLVMFLLSAFTFAQRPIEATDHNAQQSRLTGSAVANENAVDFSSFGGNFAAGDYLSFPHIDFDAGNFRRLMMFLSAPEQSAGNVIEIKVDTPNSAPVGTITLINSNGSQIFVPRFAEIAELSGTRDVYFYFPQATYVDIDFFVFTEYYFPIYGDTGVDDTTYSYLIDLIRREIESGRHDERMRWWRDATFGMFIHFGAYALSAGSTLDHPIEGMSWQPGQDNLSTLNGKTPVWRETIQAEWIMKVPQEIPRDIYKEFIVRPFNPYLWNAEEIVRLAQQAGMHYLVITARHHDGLSMYHTNVRTHRDFSMRSVANHGNWERDIIREIADAAQATYGTEREVIFGAYLTLPDWGDPSQYPLFGVFPGGSSGRKGDATENFAGNSAEERERNRDEYLSRLKGQMRELIVDYGARIIWFDDAHMITLTSAQSYAIYNFARSLNPDVILNNRFTTFRDSGHRPGHIDFHTPEHRLLTSRPTYDFEVCYTLNDRWGFHANDHNWKSPTRVAEMLTQTAGLNGNLLLNIGPDGAGRVPQPSVDILRAVGSWLDVVSESIHGTRGGFYEGSELPNGVFSTVREGRLFFHLLPSFTASTLKLPAPNNRVTGARVMNTDSSVKIAKSDGYLFLDFPDIIRDPLSTVIEVQVEGMPERAISD